jgi:cell pole-organizing protein PopZ
MAQANSVQREPSMEEILASIRRIIEDSDTSRKPGEAEPIFRHAAEEAEAGEEAGAEIRAFREELQPEAAPAQSPRPFSLAQIQAEARREAGQQSLKNVDVHEEQPVAQSEPAPVIEAAEEVEDDAGFKAGDPFRQLARPDYGAARNQNPKPAIISEKASRQVAASFEELSEAFSAERRRSFDEMAEEMLRPMLQDWLDNNLPVLVERLVREEIERVARGGAR